MDFVQAAVDYLGSIKVVQDDFGDSYSSRGSSRERRRERERRRARGERDRPNDRDRDHEKEREDRERLRGREKEKTREKEREREKEKEKEKERRRRREREHGQRRHREHLPSRDVERVRDLERQQEISDQHRRENAELLQRLDEIERKLEVTQGQVDYYKKRRKETEADRRKLLERNQELERQLQGSRASPDRRLQSKSPPALPTELHLNGTFVPMLSLDRQARSLSPIDLRPTLGAIESDARLNHPFLDQEDVMDGAHLIEMLSDLNIEIARFSGFAVGSLVFLRPWENKKAWAMEPTPDVVERGFGEKLCGTILESGFDHSRDPTLVQIAIQAWEVHCVAVSAFEMLCPGAPTNMDEELQRIFRQMRLDGIVQNLSRSQYRNLHSVSEPLPVATKWRSLTRLYCKLATVEAQGRADAAAEKWTQYNLNGLSYILRTAGCKDPAVPNADTLRHLFGGRIETIRAIGTELAYAMREKVISADFDIIMEEIGTPYEATMMQCDFSTKEEEINAQELAPEIVCTVNLGLSSTRMNQDTQDLRLQRTVVVKPKVILPFVLQSLRMDNASPNGHA